MNIKGTKTEKNLMDALKGESIARNKYTYFAQAARKDGNIQTAELFEMLADNEKEHAKLWYKLLNGELGDAKENLKAAMQGENMEWNHMYPEFAKTAREEGLDTVASMFDGVAEIEKNHEKVFMQEFIRISGEQHMAEKQPEPPKPAYRCAFCGHIHKAGEAPVVCPLCQAIGAFERVMV